MYDELFAEKVERLRSLINWDGPVDKFESERTHFRMRANFNLWYDNPQMRTDPSLTFYAMFDPEEKGQALEIKSFPRGADRINTLMVELHKLFFELKDLFLNAFEVRFLTTLLDEESIVTICYKKPLTEGWQAAADDASKRLNAKIIGRARKMKKVAGGGEDITEEYTVKGRTLKFRQTEGAFSQPNGRVCEKMITWAMDATDNERCRESDLLELYCGGGTFTACMAANFRKVLATELSKVSVKLAQDSFKLNGIENIKIARLSSEEFSDAYSNKRQFKRLAENGIAFNQYDISTVLVDPPRAGLDPETCKLLTLFDRIVYISCNPETLARDLLVLKESHTVEKVAAFDQFPYTHHLEGGVLLVRKPQMESEKAESMEKTEKAESDADDEAAAKRRKLD